MIKVFSHGDTISVKNPTTQEWQTLVNVTFVEEGRSGGDPGMSESSNVLSELAGEDVGLHNLRVHTHPIAKDKLKAYPIGKTFPAFINRKMFSKPQMRQQLNVPAREIDGKATYFKTYISKTKADDIDLRVSDEVLSKTNPEILRNATVGATEVRVLSSETRKGPQPNRAEPAIATPNSQQDEAAQENQDQRAQVS